MLSSSVCQDSVVPRFTTFPCHYHRHHFWNLMMANLNSNGVSEKHFCAFIKSELPVTAVTGIGTGSTWVFARACPGAEHRTKKGAPSSCRNLSRLYFSGKDILSQIFLWRIQTILLLIEMTKQIWDLLILSISTVVHVSIKSKITTFFSLCNFLIEWYIYMLILLRSTLFIYRKLFQDCCTFSSLLKCYHI